MASVVGLGAYFILSPSSTNSLSVQIRSAEKDLADLKVKMAADKNASEQLELEVSRSSSAYTQRLNDATSAKEKLEIEQEAGQPKSEELDQQIADAEDELETLGKELAEASAPLQDIEIQSKPLTERGSPRGVDQATGGGSSRPEAKSRCRRRQPSPAGDQEKVR